MKIYNTLSKQKEEFKPLQNKKVQMYVCGLTPYDHAHIGHARTFVAFDILKRFLMYLGYEVFHIQNITDIDDKILKRAKELGENPITLAERFHNEALRLFDQLNILRADIYPKVSDHINDIINMVSKLVERGYAYKTPTGVYFSVEKFKDYGKLSNQKPDEIREKHRIEPDPTKKDSIDFALWKITQKGEEPIGFDSPFGYGRPGWHIECSVMSLKYIEGDTLDIHGGARDLIFPHHENEIAQSEAYTGKPFVRYWIHAGFLTVNGEKMSKSLGNFITLKEALEKYDPLVLRYFLASKKYSSPLDWSEHGIKESKKALEKIKEFYMLVNILLRKGEYKNSDDYYKKLLKHRNMFIEALKDDLDTPKALAELFNAISLFYEGHKAKQIGKPSLEIMKIFLEEFSFIFGIPLVKGGYEKEDELITLLLEVRKWLRKNKLFEYSDKIRDKLEDLGIKVYDEGEESYYVFK